MQKEVKKIGVKKEPQKLTTKEAPKRVTTQKIEKITVKPEPKKVTTKEVKKIALKEVSKPIIKEVRKKKPKEDEKKAYYDAMSLEDCIMNMKKMNVQYHYEDYAQLLHDELDEQQLIKNIQEGNHLHELSLDYKIHGYDMDLVKVTLDKVKETIDFTPADFKNLKQAIEESIAYVFDTDEEKNAAAYGKQFHICERIMLLGKRKHFTQIKEINSLLKTKIENFTKHFMDLAYTILPSWKYEDVVFYEDFMYAYVSSFPELYLLYEQRVQIDCADLYIRHGDRTQGHAGYDYLLRDNQIKDYIYYRFAHVYEEIDMDMAKSIAYSSLQYVDERYVYYPKIMEIIQK